MHEQACGNSHVQVGQLNHVQVGQLSDVLAGPGYWLSHIQTGNSNMFKPTGKKISCAFLRVYNINEVMMIVDARIVYSH